MSPSAKPLLIVDDDTGLLRQLRWAFSDHKVHPAETRLEAIDLVRKEPVPVAMSILDFLPIQTGLPKDWPRWPKSSQ
jgi:ActR/RegA family two-component response regulator